MDSGNKNFFFINEIGIRDECIHQQTRGEKIKREGVGDRLGRCGDPQLGDRLGRCGDP